MHKQLYEARNDGSVHCYLADFGQALMVPPQLRCARIGMKLRLTTAQDRGFTGKDLRRVSALIRNQCARAGMDAPFADQHEELFVPRTAPAELRRIAECLLKCLRTQAASRKRRLISLS